MLVLKHPYFAHAVNVYNTPLEIAMVQLITDFFGIKFSDVENPNQPHHQVGYAEWAKSTDKDTGKHKGMSYFFDVVLPNCDGCVAMPFLDGRMGLGVAGEAKWFLERSNLRDVFLAYNTQMPDENDLERFIKDPKNGLFVIRPLTFDEGSLILAGDPKLVVPHEETRLRTWKIYGQEGRSYESAHLVSLPIPEGFYPPKP